MQKRKNFIYINEPFNCEYCNTSNPLPQKGIRNHCNTCLCSKHVDDDLPGDRDSKCHGQMTPTSIKGSQKREWILTHTCLECGKKNNNKIAEDDNIDIIAELIHKTNLRNAQQAS
jgi:hypothetical protein